VQRFLNVHLGNMPSHGVCCFFAEDHLHHLHKMIFYSISLSQLCSATAANIPCVIINKAMQYCLAFEQLSLAAYTM